jgi:hypothetical protein
MSWGWQPLGELAAKVANWFVSLVGERSRLLPGRLWIGLVLLSMVMGIWLVLLDAPEPIQAIEQAVAQNDLEGARRKFKQLKDRHSARARIIEARLLMDGVNPSPSRAGQMARSALASDPTLARSPLAIDTLVMTLDSPDADESKRIIVEWIGKPATKSLLRATRSRSYRMRWNAVDAIRRLGAAGSLDMVEIYSLDLTTATSCIVRRRAAYRLGQLGDARALPALQQAMGRGWYANLCMGTTLNTAMERIRLGLNRSQGGPLQAGSTEPQLPGSSSE